MLDMLFHCVADAGNVVLVPAPYYPAFDNDLRVCRLSEQAHELVTDCGVCATVCP